MPVWQLAQTEWQGSLQRLGMALSHQFVTGGTTLLLRALRAQQVTEARRAAHELASGGEFEPLGNGLLGLLHGERSKTETDLPLGKAFVRESGDDYLKSSPTEHTEHTEICQRSACSVCSVGNSLSAQSR